MTEFKKIEVNEPEPGYKVLSIEVALEELNKEMEREYGRLGKKISVPGFRKGKAPRHILEAKYKDAVRSEALEKVVSKATWESLEEQKVVPFFDPEIDSFSAPEGEPIKFEVKVDLWPGVEMKKYQDFEFARKLPAIPEEEVEREIDALKHHHVEYTVVQRAAIKGDRVKMSYQRFFDNGDAFGKRVDDVEMLLDAPPGSDIVPLTMTKELIGVEPGDSRSVTIDFPDEHAIQSLAGKKVEFRLEVHEIGERVLPVYDDAFATRVVGKETTAEALTELVRDELKRRAESEVGRALRDQVFEKLIGENKIDISERILERVTKSSLPDFIPVEEIPEDHRTEAQEQRERITKEQRERSLRVIQKLAIVSEISKREKLEPSEREIKSAARAFLPRERSSEPSERRQEEETAWNESRRMIREEKVYKWVLEHSKVNEE